MPLFKKRKQKVPELKAKEQLELLKEGLKTGKAKRVYKVLIRDPLVGIKEDYWELSEEQENKWVDEEGIAYINLHYEAGQPQYSFVSKMLWDKWDKVEEIMLNQTLSSEEQAQAIQKLAKGK